jgi:hypothetical protein
VSPVTELVFVSTKPSMNFQEWSMSHHDNHLLQEGNITKITDNSSVQKELQHLAVGVA